MFQYALPTTCKNEPTAPTPYTGTFFDLPAQHTAFASSPCCAAAAAYGYAFAPPRAPELDAFAMVGAAPHDLRFRDSVAYEINAMLLTPLDAGYGLGYMDELDHAMWIRTAAILSTTSSTALPVSKPEASGASRKHVRRLSCPAEMERRRAHRRSLQKGYEKGYRQRKRETREELRQQWFALEYQLKHELRTVQNNRAVVQRTHGSGCRPRAALALQELYAECTALRTENAQFECMLATEARLRDAREYFSQPKMREKLNALATTPSVASFQFTW